LRGNLIPTEEKYAGHRTPSVLTHCNNMTSISSCTVLLFWHEIWSEEVESVEPVRADPISKTEKSFDSLFSALDGKSAGGAPARILGIYDDGSNWWIQVARGDDDVNTVVLQVSHFASIFQILTALTRWNVADTASPRIIRTMSLV
jgi:hypothetical protein